VTHAINKSAVIPTGAVFQAEGGILRAVPGVVVIRARSLGPLEKTRAFGMTQRSRERDHFPTQDTTLDAGVDYPVIVVGEDRAVIVEESS
jgi:hypothetical protein